MLTSDAIDRSDLTDRVVTERAGSIRSVGSIPDILLVTVNAGYAHTSMALRCIMANLGDLAARTRILETDSRLTPLQIAERILDAAPRIVAFSVYIWNATAIRSVIRVIRAARPEIKIVAGGPQIVPGDDPENLLETLDVAVSGEGELVMRSVFAQLLAGDTAVPLSMPRMIVADAPNLAEVELPYALYSDADIATRMVYAEATRGCPFRCEYCVSSESGGIRNFPLAKLLPAFETLLARGVRQFKFLDRSFNHGGAQSLAVLEFFRARLCHGLRLHFEFTPDALDAAWQRLLAQFPPHTLHIEIGIQTFNPDVARRIKRPLDPARVAESLRFMIHDARADVHADLIAGLPGETRDSFAAGFDTLVRLAPAEIQVGILKRLPGTKIGRHDAAFGVRWNPLPPYDILENATMTFAQLRDMERLSRCWDMLYNRGRFRHTVPLLWRDDTSPFEKTARVAESVYARCGRMHDISPKRLAEALLAVLVAECGVDEKTARASLERDAREFNWEQS